DTQKDEDGDAEDVEAPEADGIEDKEAINDTEITIDFNTQKGSAIDSITVEYETLLKDIPEPTKEGYTFLGWYQDKDYTNKWEVKEDKAIKDITLYARWEKEDKKDSDIVDRKTGKTSTTNSVGTSTIKDTAIEITGTPVNVREGTTTSYKIIDSVSRGEIYLAFEKATNGWYKIRTENGNIGWVSGNLSEEVNYQELEIQSVPISYVEITGNTLNVRKGPSADDTKIDTTYNGESYMVLDVASNGWYKIRSKNNQVGWISG